MEVQKFTFNPFQENSYVLFDETKECVIIDPGCSNSQERDELFKFIDKYALKPQYVLNTHCHIDHMLGVSDCLEKYNVNFYAHSAESFNLEKLKIQADLFGMQLSPNPIGIDRAIEEGEELTFGNTQLKVLLVPGHSPGHLAFYSDADKVVISGDILFDGSIGRTDLPGCNHDELLKGIKEKMYALPHETIVYAGHMSETSIGKEANGNPFVRQ